MDLNGRRERTVIANRYYCKPITQRYTRQDKLTHMEATISANLSRLFR